MTKDGFPGQAAPDTGTESRAAVDAVDFFTLLRQTPGRRSRRRPAPPHPCSRSAGRRPWRRMQRRHGDPGGGFLPVCLLQADRRPRSIPRAMGITRRARSDAVAFAGNRKAAPNLSLVFRIHVTHAITTTKHPAVPGVGERPRLPHSRPDAFRFSDRRNREFATQNQFRNASCLLEFIEPSLLFRG